MHTIIVHIAASAMLAASLTTQLEYPPIVDPPHDEADQTIDLIAALGTYELKVCGTVAQCHADVERARRLVYRIDETVTRFSDDVRHGVTPSNQTEQEVNLMQAQLNKALKKLQKKYGD